MLDKGTLLKRGLLHYAFFMAMITGFSTLHSSYVFAQSTSIKQDVKRICSEQLIGPYSAQFTFELSNHDKFGGGFVCGYAHHPSVFLCARLTAGVRV